MMHISKQVALQPRTHCDFDTVACGVVMNALEDAADQLGTEPEGPAHLIIVARCSPSTDIARSMSIAQQFE